MIPNVDDRIASVIRSLTEVILPHLPPEASLAQEQAQLAIGHLQILRAQFDVIPTYEREELADAIAIANALGGAVTGQEKTTAAIALVKSAVRAADGSDVRSQTKAIHLAIDALVRAVSADGAAGAQKALSDIILQFEQVRVQKDRKWYLPFGFDTM